MSWKCKHCHNNFNFNKTTEKANHTRWCESNPKAKKFRSENIERGKLIGNKNADKLYGLKKKFNVKCEHCSLNFSIIERQKTFPSKERYFCSKDCARSYSANSFWDTIKSGQRILKDDWGFKNKECYELTMAHRKKNYIRKCELTNKLIYEHTCHECEVLFESTTNSRKFCSNKCKRKNRRKGKENLQTYRRDASFKFSLNDYPNKFDFTLIEKYGWYSAANHGNNLNGVSRDHMVSVKYGFNNNIPADIIGHPANCKLMQHSKNSSKHSGCSIKIDKLMERIKQWDTESQPNNCT